jgi:hypothetical protein
VTSLSYFSDVGLVITNVLCAKSGAVKKYDSRLNSFAVNRRNGPYFAFSRQHGKANYITSHR